MKFAFAGTGMSGKLVAGRPAERALFATYLAGGQYFGTVANTPRDLRNRGRRIFERDQVPAGAESTDERPDRAECCRDRSKQRGRKGDRDRLCRGRDLSGPRGSGLSCPRGLGRRES